jgi:NAD(P)H-hydrate epimerase
VCGKGNNGGDGLVAARLLRQAGRDVDVMCVWDPAHLSPDARANALKLPGGLPERFDPERLARANAIVDAVFGTGFAGAPREPASAAITAMNEARAQKIAADVPSGVNASTGEVAGVAVSCAATVTFHRGKTGLWINPGKAHAGEVHVVDIGIPRTGSPEAPDHGLITPGVLRDMPRRRASSTKFSSGNVFIVGGSTGLTGAPCMAAMAAIRAGAGYVTVGAPAPLELSFTVRLLEAMMVGLPADDGALSAEGLEQVVKAIGRADAVVLGPGLSKKPGAQQLARDLFERIDVPLVIDADGLNALQGVFPEDLPQRRWPTILTPHAGELARLLEVDSKEIERARLEHACEAARRAKSFVVLKGDDTLVVTPRGQVAVSRGNAPALATAGTGDVLSGVIGAMLAKGLAPAQAACAAVYVHVRAGQLAAAPHGPDGVIASDVIHALPEALNG